jgi:hypothetical protein
MCFAFPCLTRAGLLVTFAKHPDEGTVRPSCVPPGASRICVPKEGLQSALGNATPLCLLALGLARSAGRFALAIPEGEMRQTFSTDLSQ